jgi:hypothetical protein
MNLSEFNYNKSSDFKQPSINNNQKSGGLERQLSFTISVPSRLSGHMDAEGILNFGNFLFLN